MDDDSYSLKVKGEKLYIIGGHDYSAMAAVRQAKSLITSEREEGEVLEFAKGYELNGVYDSTLTDSEFNLSWSEEFEGDTLNWQTWNTDKSSFTGVNGKTSQNTLDAVTVSDGMLNFTASEDENGYYGGQIDTCGLVSYKYGYSEAKMYIPEEAGLWPAFWARGLNTASGKDDFTFIEVDFFERFGSQNSGQLKSSILRWDYDKNASTQLSGGELYQKAVSTDPLSSIYYDKSSTWVSGIEAGWHTVGCDWTENYMRFIVDGEVFYEFDYTYDKDTIKELMNGESLYLVFGMLAGVKSDMVNTPDSTTDWNEQFKVDWVHIYQKTGQTLKVTNS